MDFRLRTASIGDTAHIEALFIEEMQSIFHTADVRGYDAGYLNRFFRGKEDRICVAERNGEVVAFLSIEVHHEDEDTLYLDDFSVTESCRGMGIGSALLKKAEEYAESLRIPAIYLHAEQTNTEALRLYRRFGYAVCQAEGQRYLLRKKL